MILQGGSRKDCSQYISLASNQRWIKLNVERNITREDNRYFRQKRNQPHWHWRKPGNGTGREFSIDQRQYAEAEGGIAKCCATAEGVREVQGPGRNNCYKRGTSGGASGNCFRNLFRQWQREAKR